MFVMSSCCQWCVQPCLWRNCSKTVSMWSYKQRKTPVGKSAQTGNFPKNREFPEKRGRLPNPNSICCQLATVQLTIELDSSLDSFFDADHFSLCFGSPIPSHNKVVIILCHFSTVFLSVFDSHRYGMYIELNQGALPPEPPGRGSAPAPRFGLISHWPASRPAGQQASSQQPAASCTQHRSRSRGTTGQPAAV